MEIINAVLEAVGGIFRPILALLSVYMLGSGGFFLAKKLSERGSFKKGERLAKKLAKPPTSAKPKSHWENLRPDNKNLNPKTGQDKNLPKEGADSNISDVDDDEEITIEEAISALHALRKRGGNKPPSGTVPTDAKPDSPSSDKG